ncbi:MAG: RIO1 family regulatory kinase/ATPase [Candidatus Pacearchaeota archaeon]
MEKIIGTGAEAILIQKDGKLIKRRIKKSYRIQILDEKLRKSRTKKESKLLEKASKLIPVPKIIKLDEKNKEIDMKFVEGLKLSENLDSLQNAEEICKIIGQNIAKIHDADIIHGDLTTSNMIYVKDKNAKTETSSSSTPTTYQKQISDNTSQGKVYFIDFGLGFESKKIEDKAVDLHLLKQALEAKHFNNYEKFFSAVLEGYKLSKHHEATLHRLKKVEARGRYKEQF